MATWKQMMWKTELTILMILMNDHVNCTPVNLILIDNGLEVALHSCTYTHTSIQNIPNFLFFVKVFSLGFNSSCLLLRFLVYRILVLCLLQVFFGKSYGRLFAWFFLRHYVSMIMFRRARRFLCYLCLNFFWSCSIYAWTSAMHKIQANARGLFDCLIGSSKKQVYLLFIFSFLFNWIHFWKERFLGFLKCRMIHSGFILNYRRSLK